MKFFATSQIRQLDKYTIEYEPITSIDLMERAADALYTTYLETFSYKLPALILAGPGNNGGDALALARMLLHTKLDVKVILLYSDKLSNDCETNRNLLVEMYPDALTELTEKFAVPEIANDTIIVDGLFGSGINRILTGIFAEAIKWINHNTYTVVAIDVPSGLLGEENPLHEKPVIVQADYTLSLQCPKLAFLFPENEIYVGEWKMVDIGIHPAAIEETESDFYYLEKKDIAPLIKKRSKFSHKGTFGHALIVAGSKGMSGASVLAAKAALRTGAGLVTIHGPECNRNIVQTIIPEVIFQSDYATDLVSNVDASEKHNAIAIGPGIGVHAETTEMLKNFLKKQHKPCVLDADALNILSQHKDLLKLIPENSILTPHPKEFDRLFGPAISTYERMKKASLAAQDLELTIILKGAYTIIATPEAKVYFNSTGNSGMATAGSGDVLTGILVGLLAQGYLPEDAAKTGVYLHGLAGDLALETQSEESLISGDIIAALGKAYLSFRE